MKKKMIIGYTLGLTILFFCAQAQINPSVKNTTKDHARQVIGYITQWDAWKGDAHGIPQGAYNHLNIDYSQYTILNFSFFGVAKDGSLHSADLRNKQIYQNGVDQEPGKLVNDDIYSSFDLFFLKGDVQAFWTIDSYLSGLGYVADGNGWKNNQTGESGTAYPIYELKQNPGFHSIFKIAHDRGVKVLASIGGWSMCKHFGDVAADAGKRKKFTDDCKKLIAFGFDGIDIDWEYPGRSGMNFTGTPADFTNYAVLVEEIKAAIGSTKLLTGCFSAVVKPNEFDWNRLNNSMDYFNMMSYDYNGGWSNIAGHNAPLYDYPNQEYPDFSLDATLKGLRKMNVNLRKVNLGTAFYGRGVICQGAAALNTPTVKVNVTVQPDGPISTCADYDNFKLDVWDGAPNYSYIMNNTAGWTEKWDDIAKVPYKTNNKYFLSYDNVKSTGLKAQYIKDNNLAGIIIWHVYGDLMNMKTGPVTKGKFVYCPNTTSPLVNEINEVFAGKPANIHDQYTDTKGVKIYPNPSNGNLVIHFENPVQPVRIAIYNNLGQVVLEQVTAESVLPLDLNHLNKGTYIVRIYGEGNISNQKIIIY